MRGSAGAPQATARRSDHAPAQQIAARGPDRAARVGDRDRLALGSRATPPAHPVTTRPPRRSSRRRSSPPPRAKSTTPVAGECRAAIPVACGSISRSSSGPIRRSPGPRSPVPAAPARRAPPARPRRSRRSPCRSSPSDPVLVAVGVELARARDAQPGLQRAGPVVDPRRGSRRWSCRSGGPRSSARARAPPPAGRRGAAPAPSPSARPTIPAPTTTTSHSRRRLGRSGSRRHPRDAIRRASR